jgi:hypothetical protein
MATGNGTVESKPQIISKQIYKELYGIQKLTRHRDAENLISYIFASYKDKKKSLDAQGSIPAPEINTFAKVRHYKPLEHVS